MFSSAAPCSPAQVAGGRWQAVADSHWILQQTACSEKLQGKDEHQHRTDNLHAEDPIWHLETMTTEYPAHGSEGGLYGRQCSSKPIAKMPRVTLRAECLGT